MGYPHDISMKFSANGSIF